MRLGTRVAIVGAGPAGLVLANVLQRAGIDCVVVERQTRSYVEARARAGLIEHRTVEFLRRHGLAERLLAEGAEHGSCEFRFQGERFSIPYRDLAGDRSHYVYPQQFLVRDLVESYLDAGGKLLFSHPVVALDGLDGDRPVLRCEPAEGSQPLELECDFVAGCDGFHGVSRQAVPDGRLRAFSKHHEFGWLAVLAETPPASEQIIYALHEDGFAGHMLRTPSVTRFYLQCPVGDVPENWPDERIWSALWRRLGMTPEELKPGEITEKNVLDMRSFVVEPMQHGRLFLVGDAAHIITPAGGKGMNLAIADAEELAVRLLAHYGGADADALDGYSAACLPRIWQAQEFSHWMLHLLHSPAARQTDSDFMHRLQLSRLAQLRDSATYSMMFSDSYVGAPGRSSEL
ncbi:4-hydroxybenzoate 3-monooxygenase [Kitasatospora sp. GP82]|uniref:4-hydroxybenzoate 3-monooxygenase n=1 Tax=Kitasatospora sp. GP82 TaxID=3035089 RepID=UPI0024758245|nr:4-hydroxybenzoate 3-monooxygenase [Kitasatospora sp. GP82]MDH6124057.1 p-hydroxybenzoate 3-monooxygenase [Kitasatospora sp. GP82]